MSVNAVNGTALSTANAEQTKKTFKQDEPVSIMEFDAGKANKTVDIDLVSTDGDNDGKLSAGEVVKLAVKGAGEDTKNALLSPLGIAGMIGVTALAICPVTAPFVAPLAVAGAAIGVGAGAIKTVSGIGKMIGAETDAEAKSGAKQTGSGAFTTTTSAFALKAGLKEMSKVEGSHMEAAYKEGTSKTKAYFQDVKEMATELNPFPRKGNLSQKEIDEIFKSYEAEQNIGTEGNLSQNDIDNILANHGLGPKATHSVYNNDGPLTPNMDLTPEQARINLTQAQEAASGTFSNRSDWKVAQVKLKQAQLDYDTAQSAQQDTANVLRQILAKQTGNTPAAPASASSAASAPAASATPVLRTTPDGTTAIKPDGTPVEVKPFDFASLPQYGIDDVASINAAVRASGAPKVGDNPELVDFLLGKEPGAVDLLLQLAREQSV